MFRFRWTIIRLNTKHSTRTFSECTLWDPILFTNYIDIKDHVYSVSRYIYIYTHTHTQRVPKKCIHILRDIIYVKCVYIFWHPLYIYIYLYRGCQKNVYTSEGAKKMYTHFKRYLCKMCIHFLAPSVYIHIFVQRVPKNVYTSEGAKKMYTRFKKCYLCKMCIHFCGILCVCVCVCICIYIYIYIYV